MISIVGAGGKTTLLERLARDLIDVNDTVLVTTTTHILLPAGDSPEQIIITSRAEDVVEQARPLLLKYRRLTAAAALLPREGKLVGFAPPEIKTLMEEDLFRWILVEADGAKHLPLKAPAPHEPAIPPSSRWVIGVAGLDAIGQPLTDEWVFRSRLFANLTGLEPGARITPQAAALALSLEAGIMKGAPAEASRIIFLNKAETPARKEAAYEIVESLRKRNCGPPLRVVVGALAREELPLECCEV